MRINYGDKKLFTTWTIELGSAESNSDFFVGILVTSALFLVDDA